MTQETALLFHSLVRDNLPVDRLVDSNYTFMNQELAAHYGIEGVLEMNEESLFATRSEVGYRTEVFSRSPLFRRVSPVMRGNGFHGAIGRHPHLLHPMSVNLTRARGTRTAEPAAKTRAPP